MNVKPGDMALVVWPSGFAGATCTVLKSCPSPLLGQDGVFWLVRFPRPMAWGTVNNPGDMRLGAMPDSELRKIAGPDVPVETTRSHEVPA